MSASETIEYIEHKAVVVNTNPEEGQVTLRIEDTEECGECPASKFCNSRGEPSTKVVVNTPMASRLRKGDFVTVRGTERMHRKAIMYATVFPCIILVAFMVGIYLLTGSQLAAALSGLGATVIFYIVLWACRNKIAHEFIFTITGEPERAGDLPLGDRE